MFASRPIHAQCLPDLISFRFGFSHAYNLLTPHSFGSPNTAAVMGRPGTAATLSVDQLRSEWLTLRGELGVARSQLSSTRQDKVYTYVYTDNFPGWAAQLSLLKQT